jgi:integrase
MGRTKLPYSLSKRTVGNKTLWYYHLDTFPRGKRLSTGKTLKKEAMDHLHTILEERKNIKPETLHNSFRMIAKPFYEDKTKCPWMLAKMGTNQKVVPSTVRTYLFQKQLIMNKAEFVDKNIADITVQDILAFFSSMDTSIKSKKLLYNVLVTILKEGSKQCGFEYPKSFFDSIRQKGKQEFEKGFFTDVEIEKMFPSFFVEKETLDDALDSGVSDPYKKSAVYEPFTTYYYKLLFFTLLSTGCRIGEALALQWADLNTKGRYLNISRNISRKNKITTVGDTKGHKARKAPLSVLHAKMFDSYRIICKHNKPNDYIFSFKEGVPITTSSASSALKKVMEKLEIDYKTRNITVHSFRHTFNSVMLRRGVSPLIIQKICGWSDESIQRQYSHFDDDAIKDVSNKMDDMFNDGLDDDAVEVLNDISIADYKNKQAQEETVLDHLKKELEEANNLIEMYKKEKPSTFSDYWRKRYIDFLNTIINDMIPDLDVIESLLKEAVTERINPNLKV